MDQIVAVPAFQTALSASRGIGMFLAGIALRRNFSTPSPCAFTCSITSNKNQENGSSTGFAFLFRAVAVARTARVHSSGDANAAGIRCYGRNIGRSKKFRWAAFGASLARIYADLHTRAVRRSGLRHAAASATLRADQEFAAFAIREISSD